jgi:4-hydroxyproline epimerase
LCEPVNSACTTGVIFFNNVAYLGMCGHGTIGLITTLAYLNRIGPGEHLIETPVGIVKANLLSDRQVEVENVPSYRLASAVTVQVPGYGSVTGDVAWGGNWFFLVNNHDHDLTLSNIDTLTAYTWSIREALADAGITGSDGHEIDHVELFVPSKIEGVDSKNFVLCPGKAYDRSPCGTGTSAKLACLFEDGKLKAGQVWRQESLIGSLFEGQVSLINGEIHPKIKGSAFITAEADLIIDERDPFCMGIRE